MVNIYMKTILCLIYTPYSKDAPENVYLKCTSVRYCTTKLNIFYYSFYLTAEIKIGYTKCCTPI